MSFPYRGAVVLGVSDDEVQEVLIPIRLTLERYSFLRALERMTDEDFAELGKQVWLMEQAADADDLPRHVEADLRFHEIVIAASGQTHTVQIWRTIWPRIRAYFYRYGRGQDLHRMVDEHRELLATLQSRDPDRVLALLERHIAVSSPPTAPVPRNGRKAAGRKTRAGRNQEGHRMSELLAVKDLRTCFHTHGGVIRAVDGVDFSIEKGGALGVVGESGSGKSVTALSIMRLIDLPGRIERGSSIMFEGRDLATRPGGRDGGDPRQRDLDDLPGADDLAQPGLHRRRADRRVGAAPSGRRPEGGRRAGRRDDASRRHPIRAEAGARLSAPDVRRHAAASHDRHGAQLQPEAPDRRRADDCPRRDRAGADPRADEGPARKARHGDSPDHPRPRRRRRDGRRGRRHVRRQDRRARACQGDLREPAASVHGGAAHVDPAARDAVHDPAQGDPRHGPEPSRLAPRLPLRPALRLRLRAVRPGAATPLRGGRAGVGVLALRKRPARGPPGGGRR